MLRHIVLTTLITACSSGSQPLLVLGVLEPPASSSSRCTYVADVQGPFLSVGTVDLALTHEYVPTLLLGNEILNRAPSTDDDVWPTVTVTGAVVRVTDSDGNELDNATFVANDFLPPASTNELGIATYETTLVSSAAIDKLGTFEDTKRVISFVSVVGTTSDGTHVESGEVAFAVDVCVGCLSRTQPVCD
jgi:hypothetical protein